MKTKYKNRLNPVNERAKYKYRVHCKRVQSKDDKTLAAILKHIREYELFTGFEDFKKFNATTAHKYIEYLLEQDYSLSYIDGNIRMLKEFLSWLERQKGYRSKINYNHIEYLNLTNNQRRTAKATEYKRAYTYKQILATIGMMPNTTITQKRNKAIISLQALCGLRISELRTVKLRNLVEEDGHYFIYVNPKDMEVKTAKTREANFMPLSKDIVQNVLEWRDYLLSLGFTLKDPLFPQMTNSFNQRNLLESNIIKEGIKSNTTIRNVFKEAFTTAGHEYLRPHSFRHTIVRFAEKQTPEFLNAVRQSLGHSSIDTTFQSYGELSSIEQRNRIAGLKPEF